MEFLRAPNIGPAQQIAERILQLQQQGTASIGRGIEGATESVVGGIERGRARELAAKEKTQDKADKLIKIDATLVPILKSLGLDAKEGDTMDRDILKTSITAAGASGRLERQIEAKADAVTEDREYEKTKPTDAEKSVDTAFGKDYADYVAGGGYADTEQQLKSLNEILVRLESGKEALTGPFLSALPDELRKRTYPKSFDAQQIVEQSIQRSLRTTLGAQFTEKEGAAFMKRGYDAALPEPDNANRLKRTIGQLQKMAEAKKQAAEYFEKNRTLRGFKGKLPSSMDTQPTKEERKEARVSELRKMGKSEDETIDILIAEGY